MARSELPVSIALLPNSTGPLQALPWGGGGGGGVVYRASGILKLTLSLPLKSLMKYNVAFLEAASAQRDETGNPWPWLFI